MAEVRTILDIGGHKWLAPDMSKAGKIADLLNACQPATRDYYNSTKEVYVIGKGHDHVIRIEELTESAVVVKSIAEAIKLRGPKDEKSKDTL